jgi:LmbE family N-acetylglucosaminyl deacetylase
MADLGVFNDDASRRQMVAIIRSAAPDIVLTASPVDYHPDHETTSLLVRDACFAAAVPHYKAGETKPLEATPHLYFMDPAEGRDRDGREVRPEFGVNIGVFLETKRKMLDCHKSQNVFMQRFGLSCLADAMEHSARARGGLFGVPFAEGFRQCRSFAFPRSNLLQVLIGAALLN